METRYNSWPKILSEKLVVRPSAGRDSTPYSDTIEGQPAIIEENATVLYEVQLEEGGPTQWIPQTTTGPEEQEILEFAVPKYEASCPVVHKVLSTKVIGRGQRHQRTQYEVELSQGTWKKLPDTQWIEGDCLPTVWRKQLEDDEELGFQRVKRVRLGRVIQKISGQ